MRREERLETVLTNSQQALQGILYFVVWGSLLVFTFYIYFKAIFPYTAYLKDALLFLAAGFGFLYFLTSWQWREATFLDVLVALLLAYLFFQLVYTTIVTHSPAAAYYGFRLNFFPTVLYFAFRAVRGEKRRARLQLLAFRYLQIGAWLTLFEFLAVGFHILPRSLFFRIAAVSESLYFTAQAGFPRPVGIAGTPHISGIYHLVLFCWVLFLAVEGFERKKRFSRAVRRPYLGTALLAFSAMLFSTSRTALVVFVVIFFFFLLTRRSAGSFLMAMAGALIVGIVLYGVWQLLVASGSAETFLIFFTGYWKTLQIFMQDIYQKSPLLGFGYEVGALAPLDLAKIPLANLEVQTDLFVIQIFKMLGVIGLALFFFLFFVFPIHAVLDQKRNAIEQGAALALLAVGISFAHYSPLQSPPVAVVVWYLFSLLGNRRPSRKRSEPLAVGAQ